MDQSSGFVCTWILRRLDAALCSPQAQSRTQAVAAGRELQLSLPHQSGALALTCHKVLGQGQSKLCFELLIYPVVPTAEMKGWIWRTKDLIQHDNFTVSVSGNILPCLRLEPNCCVALASMFFISFLAVIRISFFVAVIKRKPRLRHQQYQQLQSLNPENEMYTGSAAAFCPLFIKRKQIEEIIRGEERCCTAK